MRIPETSTVLFASVCRRRKNGFSARILPDTLSYRNYTTVRFEFSSWRSLVTEVSYERLSFGNSFIKRHLSVGVDGRTILGQLTIGRNDYVMNLIAIRRRSIRIVYSRGREEAILTLLSIYRTFAKFILTFRTRVVGVSTY